MNAPPEPEIGAGGAWAGTHGSNFAARYETEGLSPITTQTVYAGMQVYKAHERGESGYALPGRYAGHADTRDYYHSGIVLSASPLQIGHVTTPGAAVDLKMGKWRYGGALKKVAYEGQYPNQTTKDTALLAELKALVLKYSE